MDQNGLSPLHVNRLDSNGGVITLHNHCVNAYFQLIYLPRTTNNSVMVLMIEREIQEQPAYRVQSCRFLHKSYTR